MALQNCDPAAASIAALRKGAEPCRGTAQGPVGKRVQQELMTLMMSGDKVISAFHESDYLFNWVGTFHVAIGTWLPLQRTHREVPHTLLPPQDTQGNICLDILKAKWSALYEVRTILFSIQSLLGEPNIDSPLKTHATEL
ncbi:ubiquitin-conjugating enzyme E2 C-like [Apodemus sylvaticus]|uniref:ubiquitin-conjugating enzyme E2 C-like n=1 Tax=Apodemus sylvaticus TaxID=10129 RepID=UPI002241E151|nr:ubiquitin-conjugating enzyme E2 C-like [Apodemus sylvaticus]